MTVEESQAWVARSISIKHELQAGIQELREATLRSEKLFLMDLLNFSSRKAQAAEAEIGRLNNQNKSLYQKLVNNTNELKVCYQELNYTNQELCESLKSEHLTPAEAKELAKTFSEREEPTREALAKLLSAIYGLPVKPWELQSRLMATVMPNPIAKNEAGSPCKPIQLSAEAVRLKVECERLAARFASLRSQMIRLQEQHKNQCEAFHALKEKFALNTRE